MLVGFLVYWIVGLSGLLIALAAEFVYSATGDLIDPSERLRKRIWSYTKLHDRESVAVYFVLKLFLLSFIWPLSFAPFRVPFDRWILGPLPEGEFEDVLKKMQSN